jgi:predicted transport protein
MAEGYIYILFNRAHQNGLYKIGMTTNTSEERARAISGATGVPRPFEVAYEQRVSDCRRAETLLHHRLRQYRSTADREFFEVPLKLAIRALEDVAEEVGRLDEPDRHEPEPAIGGRSSSSHDAIDAVPGPNEKSRRGQQRVVVTFDEHLAYAGEKLRPVLIALRTRVLALDNRLNEKCTAGQRIAYKIPRGKIFLEVIVQRAAIVLHLADGGYADPGHIADDIPESFGWGQLKKRIVVVDTSDLAEATPFIESAYHAKP